MTTPDIDALREAARTTLEGATLGEWQIFDDGVRVNVSPLNLAANSIANMVEQGDAVEPGHWGTEFNNAAAIVATVNYLRAGGLDEARTLAAENARLTAENARLRGKAVHYKRGFGPGDGDSALAVQP